RLRSASRVRAPAGSPWGRAAPRCRAQGRRRSCCGSSGAGSLRGSSQGDTSRFFKGESTGEAKWTAVARTATRNAQARKSLSEYITERFDDFSRSQKEVARYI